MTDKPGELYDREEHIAQLQYEAGMYKSLYDNLKDSEANELLRLRNQAADFKRALEQVAIVCTDNMDRSCDHRMALDFVRQVANDAMSPPHRATNIEQEGQP